VTSVAVIKLLTFLESVFLGLLASREDPTSKSNAAFVRYMLFVAAGSLVEFLLTTSQTEQAFLFWRHFDVFMLFAVAAVFQISLLLHGYPWAGTRRFAVLLYGATAALAVLEGFVIVPRNAVAGAFGFRSEYPDVFRGIHTVVVLMASLTAVATVGVLWGCVQKAHDRRSRTQATIFLWSSLVLAALGVTVEVLYALWPAIHMPLSATATTAYLVVNPVLAFAVIRYGLLKLSPVSAVSAIMDMMSESVILTNQQGTVQYMNKAARVLTGRSQTAAGEDGNDRLVLRNGATGTSTLGYEELRNDGMGLRDRECLLETTARELVPVALSSTVLKTRPWDETGLIITLRDVSERRRIEELRDGSDRVMRHDLRNTLTGLYTLSASLVADRSLDREQHETAYMIHEGARLLHEQIDSYLYLRTVEDGSFAAPLESVELASVLHSVLHSLAPLAESANVHVAFLVDERPADTASSVEVRGIRAMLFGIFVNLVKNAVEASPFGSEVRLDVRTVPQVVVSVHNKGAIPEEIRPRFFTKFATAGKRRGTGVGAYGARMLAEALGCKVSFTTSDEEGTRIVVTFPAAAGAGIDARDAGKGSV
jgi:signal transduction histidine kinase